MEFQNKFNLYEDIINNLDSVVIVVNSEGNIIFANNSSEKLYGYTNKEFLTMNIFNLYKINRFSQLESKDNIITIKSYKKDKSSFLSITKYYKGENYIVYIIKEIHREKNNRKMYKDLAAIVESSDDAILAKDIDGFIYSWNAGAEKIYGYKKEEILGKHISIIVPKESSDDINKILNKIKNGEKIDHYETVRKRKDGSIINVSVTISPIYNDDNDIVGASTIARDITERKIKAQELFEKYEELSAVYEELTATEEELRCNYRELETAKEEADRANKAKSQFLANMSHEIRTPMNGILGVAQLLEFTKLNNQQLEYLEILKISSNHLLDIINNILDISKIESGKFKLNYNTFSIKHVVDMITREVSVSANKKAIEIMYYLDPFIKENIIGDEVRLNQILINLMNNAIKFTEHGHVYLRVKKVYEDLYKTKLEFSIEDTGIGIHDSFKDKIFEIFTQAESTYTKNYGGTGLGLAISKELINMMNGDIWFKSQEGKGSIFYFTTEFKLDLQYIKVENNKFIENTKIESIKRKENNLILIVEDNEINKKIISSFLNQLGYKYITVSNGKEALTTLENLSFRAILMDIQMPILNGYEATKIIREKEFTTSIHIPIIAMTAYAMAGDKEKFMKAGMDGYISKPFNINELEKVLRNIIK